ncbi:MAG: GlsB/YeaQ/YmgE family stress response membrane protein [Nocardioidaceae bacterium]
MTAGTVLFYVIVGTVVGLLGKFVAPRSRDNIPLWLTIVCGIGGMVIGDIIYRSFGGDGSDGLDWVQGLVTILTAAVLVALASTISGRRRAGRARRG